MRLVYQILLKSPPPSLTEIAPPLTSLDPPLSDCTSSVRNQVFVLGYEFLL